MRDQRGVVLVVVVFFAALLFTAITTFLRRSTLDAHIVRNRDQAARAEALARGGFRLALAILYQDRLEEEETGLAMETRYDVWAVASETPIETGDGGILEIHIEDAGSRVNLNALVEPEGAAVDGAEAFLADFLEKVVEEMPGRPEDKLYDTDELARALLDFMDNDDVSARGEIEDDWYQQQVPPYKAENRPLLSLAELALVRGYDQNLIEALRPYVTVYPYTGGKGPNPNTAPPWVLAALHVGAPAERRLAPEEDVRRLLNERDGGPLCPAGVNHELCVDLTTVYPEGTFLDLGHQSQVFQLEIRARYGNVRRTLVAAVDRSDLAEPRILAWRVR